MPIVVDSSVAACWALPDEFSVAADNTLALLANDIMLVPPIFWYEIRNVLLMAERRARISREQGTTALAHISEIPPTENATSDGEMVMRLARQHKLTVYDAAYVELAKRNGARLATLDKKLASAASSEGVSVIA